MLFDRGYLHHSDQVIRFAIGKPQQNVELSEMLDFFMVLGFANQICAHHL